MFAYVPRKDSAVDRVCLTTASAPIDQRRDIQVTFPRIRRRPKQETSVTQPLRQVARILVVLLLWSPVPMCWFGLASAFSQNHDMAESVVQPLAADGPSYVVATFEAQYVRGLTFLPAISEVGNALPALEIELSPTVDGYVAPRPGSPSEQLTIQQLTASGPIKLYASAIDVIRQAIADWFTERPRSLNVLVAPSPSDIDPSTGQDLRRRERTKLRLLISYEGPSFQISRFDLSHSAGDHPDLLPLDEMLASAEASLTQTDAGYVAWRPDIEPTTFRPADMSGDRAQTFTAGAIQLVLEGMLKYLTDREFMAVQVVPAEGQLDINRGLDLREDGRTELDLLIITGLVTQIRTLAAGDRIPLEDREDNIRHAFIRASSPFQAHEEGDEPRRDILKKDQLDDFLFRLSRHPGRRVDASLAPATETYGISLDYLVSENKEILFYSQISNTGTEQTDPWRYRFGLFHNQLTGNDDLFNLEYITAGFQESHAVSTSYDAKVLDSEYWRWRAYGLWSQFTASEVGFADERFTGDSWQVGAEMAWNFYQDRQLFLDLVGGARYENIEVDNQIVGIRGEEDFFLPYAGLRLQRYTEESRTDVSATVEWNVASVTDVDRRQMNRLGRLFPDDDWTVLRWDAAQSFYLEPLFSGSGADSPQPPSLAHEVALRFRGQYAFDNRLIPQEEQVAGGLYSVRGYPESVVVGDTVLIGSFEYRFHVSHAFGFEPNPSEFLGRPFRWRPQHAYGPADWDLILRGFFDIGRTISSEAFSFEKSQTLMGTGFGIELQYRSNLSLRVDWGFALEDVPGQVESGSSEIHFAATIVY